MNFELLHPAEQIIMIMNRIYSNGMTTTSGGNLSIKDDNGDIWITPAGVDKGTLTRKDIIRVKTDGTSIGSHRPSSELPFHQRIYKSRPDLKAVVHAHPPGLVAFSIVRRIPNIDLIPNVRSICGEVKMAEYGLTGSDDLGEKIASVFETGVNTVMLENHGVVTAGEDLFEAFTAFETLDFLARLEINASRIGNPIPLTEKQIEVLKNKHQDPMGDFVCQTYSSDEKEARREMCEFARRAYNQRLFTSFQGTFSQRIDEHTFIITPHEVDRKNIDVDDIVKIESGYKEAGKVPSSSVLHHKAIYEKQPHVQSIIEAQAPNIMAFAVTDVRFNTRTIPESYILLKDCPKLPFEIGPEKIADALTKDVPVAVLSNNCVIATGSSLLNAFDRLEVAEYSAKSVIDTKNLGEIITIKDNGIQDLNRVFNL